MYADTKYYLLRYNTTITTTYDFKEICDETNKLHNILPKSIFSSHDNYYIVDFNNILHRVYLDDRKIGTSNVPTSIDLNICKLSFDNYTSEEYSIAGNTYTRLLLKNLNNSTNMSYEYINLRHTQNETTVMCTEILDDASITRYHSFASVNTSNGEYLFIPQRKLNNKIFTLGSQTPNMYYNTKLQQIDPALNKYKYIHNGSSNKLSFLVDNNNDCHIVKPNGEDTVFFRMSTDSVVIGNITKGDDIMIITNNHAIVILEDSTVLHFHLPIRRVHNLVNIKVSNLIWSKQIHNSLSNNYKDNVRTFMMCNRLMDQFKIPHCVLPIIFSTLIN